MKKKKNYYLIVSSNDIHMKNKVNGVTMINHAEVSKIFDSYNIPKEFQKVIVKISLSNNIAKELLTHSVYYVRGSVIKTILSNNSNLMLESVDNVIDTKISVFNIDKVKAFYQSIIDNKLSVNYEKAVKEVYRYHYLNVKNNKSRKLKRNEFFK